MGKLFSTLYLIAVANLDTFFLAVGLRLCGKQPTRQTITLIAVVTSIMTTLSLAAGASTATLLSRTASDIISVATLLAFGVWTLFQAPRNSNQPDHAPDSALEALALASVLAVNNVGIGVAAGLGGLPPLLAGLLNAGAVVLAFRLAA